MMKGEMTPQECPCAVATGRRELSVGILACKERGAEGFPLTPEGVEMLVSSGYSVKVEHDAAAPIHYSDNSFVRVGAVIVERAEALKCDIVIHLPQLGKCDIAAMNRGALWLGWLGSSGLTRDALVAVAERGITSVALNLVEGTHGHRPFADVMAEVEGRAAALLAASMLADRSRNKGILLGGVAGVIPCEVTVIGSGIAARAVGKSAAGLGAIVRMFDNDTYSLRAAAAEIGPGVITSVLHPRVLLNALRTADVVVAAQELSRYVVGADEVAEMKRGVIVMDLGQEKGASFPSLPMVDASEVAYGRAATCGAGRVCYVTPGDAVPRTGAMALSNLFVSMLSDIMAFDGMTSLLKASPGVQRAVLTFMGKVVNARVARSAGLRSVDISLFLTLS